MSTRNLGVMFAGLCLFWPGAGSVPVQAAPITFNTALPVAKDEFIWREQLILRRSGSDPSGMNRRFSSNTLVSVLGYGATPKLALFGILPASDRSLRLTILDQEIKRGNLGISDPTLMARYTFFQEDGVGQTLRIGGFAGVKLPLAEHRDTDDDGLLPPSLQMSTGAWDEFVGMVVTFQTLKYEIDAQVSYRHNGTKGGIDFGDEFRLDGYLQYRLLPKTLSGGTPGFLYGIMEANWEQRDGNKVDGVIDANTGGRTLFLTPGLQYVTKRYIIESALQIPIYQDLNGTALERDYVLRMGFRVNF
ncbi:transporter [Kordiimonas lacus]|uniref:MetA-pathway of phenol degradation n=1 Tax=Kordiimonas lacus TaxID=637679 RepID=A0A1G6WM35_9PROT|nr:transporter [Kordiimonas lacus]SDD66146.1 hypothetical protein SAMN04488071_1135 [Kordiimonas lacus]